VRKGQKGRRASGSYLSAGKIILGDAPLAGRRKFPSLVLGPRDFGRGHPLCRTLEGGRVAALDFDVFGMNDERRINVDRDVCPLGVGRSVFVGDDALVLAGIFVGLEKEIKKYEALLSQMKSQRKVYEISFLASCWNKISYFINFLWL